MLISLHEARKKNFDFIFQLSGWALVALSCFALQVPDVQGLQVLVGTRLRTVLVSLKLERFCACPCDRFVYFSSKVKTGAAMAGPAVVALTALQ